MHNRTLRLGKYWHRPYGLRTTFKNWGGAEALQLNKLGWGLSPAAPPQPDARAAYDDI